MTDGFAHAIGIDFHLCPSLTTIEVDENSPKYKSIDGILYSKDGRVLLCYPRGKKEASFTIPDGVTHIGDGAFQNCTSLTSIIIPDSVTYIGGSAFSGCSSLTSITIPDSVTNIAGYRLFEYCDSLTSIEVDENNQYYQSIDGNLYTKDGKTLEKYAIGKKETSFTIPDNVTSIGQHAFATCDNLISITIPDSVTIIGEGAFECSSLKSVTMGSSVTNIESWAFIECRSLTSIIIPDSVEWIGHYAFYGCDELTTINFEGTVEQWNAIGLHENWNTALPATEVICSDGVVTL